MKAERDPIENLKYALYRTMIYKSEVVILSYHAIILLILASDFSLEGCHPLHHGKPTTDVLGAPFTPPW